MSANNGGANDRVVMSSALRVGLDLASVTEVARSITELGDSYLNRVFTKDELADCVGAPIVRARSLAARFAAKEAVLKVLQIDDHGIDLREIEICREPSGVCVVALSGVAQRLASSAGIVSLALSMTHEGDFAAAVIIASVATGTAPS